MAVTFDNGTMVIYVNGVVDLTSSGLVTPQTGNAPLLLGNQNQRGFFYDGTMDEVRIWSVTRTVDQLRENMTAKLTRKARKDGLVAYWRMDEGEGDTAFDLTGNGHDMRLGNAAGSDAGDPTWVTPGMP